MAENQVTHNQSLEKLRTDLQIKCLSLLWYLCVQISLYVSYSNSPLSVLSIFF